MSILTKTKEWLQSRRDIPLLIVLAATLALCAVVLPFGKGIRALVLIGGASSILLLWEMGNFRFWGSRLFLPCAMFVGLAVVAAIHAVELETSNGLLNVVDWVGVFLISFCCALIFGEGTGSILLSLPISFGASALCAVAVGRFFPEDLQMLLLLQHHNYVGLLAGFSLMILIEVLLGRKTKLGRFLFGTSAIAFAVLILKCGSRTSLLACLVALGALAFFKAREDKRGLLLFGSLIVCTFIFVQFTEGPTQARLRSAFSNVVNDETFRSRMAIWETARSGYQQRPVIGHGLGSYSEYSSKYLKEHGEDLLKRYGAIDAFQKHPHNVFLAIAYNFGAIGLVLYLCVTLHALVIASRLMNPLPLMLLVYSLAFGLLESPLHNAGMGFVLFVPLGLAYGHWVRATCQGRDASIIPASPF